MVSRGISGMSMSLILIHMCSDPPSFVRFSRHSTREIWNYASKPSCGSIVLFLDVQSHINLFAATAIATFVREGAWKLKSMYLCGLPGDRALAFLFLVFHQGRYGAKLVLAAI